MEKEQKVITIIRARGEPDEVTVEHKGKPKTRSLKLVPDPEVALPIKKRERRGLRTRQIKS